jgi:hypothetical protein
MTTYARSLNNLDLTDKSGIKNLIPNGDFKINKRKRYSINNSNIDTIWPGGTDEIVNIISYTVSTKTLVIATPTPTIVVGTVLRIPRFGNYAVSSKTNNTTFVLEEIRGREALPGVNLPNASFPNSTQIQVCRYRSFWLSDGVWYNWYSATTDYDLKFTASHEEFGADDWPTTDLIPGINENPAYRLKFQIRSAYNANSANTYNELIIRSSDLIAKYLGKTLTLSFWYKTIGLDDGEIATSISVKLFNGTSNGSVISTPHWFTLISRSIIASNNWVRATATFTVPATASIKVGDQATATVQSIPIGNDNTDYFRIDIAFVNKVATHYMTAFQIEEGNIASDFEAQPPALANYDISRYYQQFEIYTQSGDIWVPFNPPMITSNDDTDFTNINIKLTDLSTKVITIIPDATNGTSYTAPVNGEITVTIKTDVDHDLQPGDYAYISGLDGTMKSASKSKIMGRQVVSETPNSTTLKFVIQSATALTGTLLNDGSTSGKVNVNSNATIVNRNQYGCTIRHNLVERTQVSVHGIGYHNSV